MRSVNRPPAPRWTSAKALQNYRQSRSRALSIDVNLREREIVTICKRASVSRHEPLRSDSLRGLCEKPCREFLGGCQHCLHIRTLTVQLHCGHKCRVVRACGESFPDGPLVYVL